MCSRSATIDPRRGKGGLSIFTFRYQVSNEEHPRSGSPYPFRRAVHKLSPSRELSGYGRGGSVGAFQSSGRLAPARSAPWMMGRMPRMNCRFVLRRSAPLRLMTTSVTGASRLIAQRGVDILSGLLVSLALVFGPMPDERAQYVDNGTATPKEPGTRSRRLWRLNSEPGPGRWLAARPAGRRRRHRRARQRRMSW